MAGFSGGCLCGAVRYESRADSQFMGHCHCVDCRKSSGTGHCSHMGVAATDLTITGEVARHDRPADSGNIVTRCFCPVCGSPVCSTNSGWPGMVFIRASSLDDPEAFRPQMIVYDSRRPSWDAIVADLPRFAGMPPARPVAGG
jgi:hypothetical protein